MVFFLGIGSPPLFLRSWRDRQILDVPLLKFTSGDIHIFEKTGLLSWHGGCYSLSGGLIKGEYS